MGRIQIVGINDTIATPISVVGMTQIACMGGSYYIAYNKTEAADGALMKRILVQPTTAQPLSFDAGTGYTLWIISNAVPTNTIEVWTDIGQGSITGGY